MDLDSLPRHPGGPLETVPAGPQIVDFGRGPELVDWPGGCYSDDFAAIYSWAKEIISPLAVLEALKVGAPGKEVFLGEIPLSFGANWAKKLADIRSKLLEDHGNAVVCIATIAVRVVEYARQANFGRAYLIRREYPFRSPCSEIEEPSALAICTWGAPLELLEGTGFDDFPEVTDLAAAMALVWFFEAVRIQNSGGMNAASILFEVAEALKMVEFPEIWRDAEREGASLAVKATAEKGASARHALNRERSNKIKEWWLKNHNSFSSLDQAAEKASKLFTCAFRTARGHIGEAKKSLPSAGRG